MANDTLELVLSPKQAEFFTADDPWVAFVAGRGGGKTYIGGRWAWGTAMQYPGTVGLITANSYRQLIQATLKPLFAFLAEIEQPYRFNTAPPKEWGYTSAFKKHDGIISFPNGSQIVTRSLENYDDIRGSEFGWAWCDEVRDTKEEAWKVMLACLRGKGPRQLRVTSTPNGYDFLYELFVEQPRNRPAIRPRRRLITSSTLDNVRNLGEDFVDMLRSSYDADFAKQEIEGQFINVGVGQVYPTFDRTVHISNRYGYDPYRELILSADFNVEPMCWVVIQQFDGVDVVIGEIVRERTRAGYSSTESAAMDFCEVYGDHQHDIHVYGDYYGGSRTTQTTYTDYDVMLQVLRERQPRPVALLARSAEKGGNPPVVDRVTAVNSRFRNSLGEVRLMIRPECKTLIKDLERVTWKENVARREIDKRDRDLTHASDALGYAMYSLYGRPSFGFSIAASETIDTSNWEDDARGSEATAALFG